MLSKRGRPVKGHEGHGGKEADCPSCALRIARLKAGLSQEQLALRLGVSIRQVGRWERIPRSAARARLDLDALTDRPAETLGRPVALVY